MENLREVFSQYDKVIDIHIPLFEGKDWGFAFMIYLNANEVQRMIIRSDELVVNDKRVFMVVANRGRGVRQVLGL